ncbi:MAG: HAMP domain-containing sensor histidine kinase [Candidatus Pacebacteria bacterium]|nr:HAMP domain-containing sensor histidine kinase [Candidatus Paceibacterota bacterium]
MSKDESPKNIIVGGKKADFTSILVHRLRNPLTETKWTLSALLSGDYGILNEEQEKSLKKCYGGNDIAISMVNDLLNLDRLKANNTEYNDSPVKIAGLVETIISGFSARAKHKNISLTFDRKTDTGETVYSNPEKIRAILENLLENAINYSLVGDPIEVGLVSSPQEVTVTVKDKGIGIPEAEQKNIFTEFYRATNAIRHERSGAGLGLYIVKKIAEGQGGKVWFESQEGKGTTFFFTIPTNKAVS